MRQLLADIQQPMASQARHKGLEFRFEAPQQWPGWIETDRTRLSTEDSLATARADLLTATVRLYKALGGGWQNQPR